MKKDYMARLERAARWRLPPQEAEDVIADYRDIVGTPPRPDDELLRDLGKPWNVTKPLTEKKAYYTWLAAFAVMAACILIPADSPLPLGLWRVFDHLFSPYGILIPGIPWCFHFIVIGLILSLIWFRPQKGEPKAPLPRPVIVTLAMELALMAAVWWGFWQLTLYPDGIMFQPALVTYWFDSIIGRTTLHGHWLAWALEWGGAAVGVVGVVGLVKARTRNRRWRAVYFMSLSVMMLAFCVLSIYSYMGPIDPASTVVYTRQLCAAITIVGILGTGVSLC